jgi:hypothetical protein
MIKKRRRKDINVLKKRRRKDTVALRVLCGAEEKKEMSHNHEWEAIKLVFCFKKVLGLTWSFIGIGPIHVVIIFIYFWSSSLMA